MSSLRAGFSQNGTRARALRALPGLHHLRPAARFCRFLWDTLAERAFPLRDTGESALAAMQRERYVRLAIEAYEMARKEAEGPRRTGYLRVARHWLDVANDLAGPALKPAGAMHRSALPPKPHTPPEAG
jgi:hypothetical protein